MEIQVRTCTGISALADAGRPICAPDIICQARALPFPSTGRRRAHPDPAHHFSPVLLLLSQVRSSRNLAARVKRVEPRRLLSFLQISSTHAGPGSSARELASGKRRSSRRPPFPAPSQASCSGSSCSYPFPGTRSLLTSLYSLELVRYLLFAMASNGRNL